jgi:flagellar hook-basal body complex protein FliE
MASPISAASAYAKLARLADPSASLGKASESAGPSFGAMVKDAIGSVVAAGKKSDGLAQGMAAGKANIVDGDRRDHTEAASVARLGARQGDPGRRGKHADADQRFRSLSPREAGT